MTAPTFAGSTVLVTGAQGFIGSWLTQRLLELGASVVVTRRDIDPWSRLRAEGLEEHCTTIEADVCDYEAMLGILTRHEVDTVFHLAAQAIVGVANRSPLSTFETNVRGTYSVLEACRTAGTVGQGVDRIVVASSDHAYGTHHNLPYREGFDLKPVYPYDVSKACTDMIARSYASAHGLPIAVTRLANVYGGGDRNWSRIVPDCARRLVRGKRPIIRSDGTPERDFLYVEDAVDAYVAVAGSLARRDLWGKAWNAGWGRPVSVLELVDRLVSASAKDLEPEVRGRGTPRAEMQSQYLDAAFIRAELGWQPRFDLDQGLARAYAWYQEHLAGERRTEARVPAA